MQINCNKNVSFVSFSSKWMNEWINEWVNKRTNKWTNKRTNERTKNNISSTQLKREKKTFFQFEKKVKFVFVVVAVFFLLYTKVLNFINCHKIQKSKKLKKKKKYREKLSFFFIYSAAAVTKTITFFSLLISIMHTLKFEKTFLLVKEWVVDCGIEYLHLRTTQPTTTTTHYKCEKCRENRPFH